MRKADGFSSAFAVYAGLPKADLSVCGPESSPQWKRCFQPLALRARSVLGARACGEIIAYSISVKSYLFGLRNRFGLIARPQRVFTRMRVSKRPNFCAV